jgi:MFS transporter, PHS family, inorganic phosphate transporter
MKSNCNQNSHTNTIHRDNSSPWLNHVLEIFALFMLMGCFTTLLIPETKRKTLEQLAGEVPGTPEYDPRLAIHPAAGVSETGSDPAKEEAHIGEK